MFCVCLLGQVAVLIKDYADLWAHHKHILNVKELLQIYKKSDENNNKNIDKNNS